MKPVYKTLETLLAAKPKTQSPVLALMNELKAIKGEAFEEAPDFEEGQEEEQDKPEPSDAFFSDSGQLGAKTSVSVNNKFLGEFNEMEEAEAALKKWMEQNKFYPNVWYISDHGNISPHTLSGASAEAEASESTEPAETGKCVVCDQGTSDKEGGEFVCNNSACNKVFQNASGERRDNPGVQGSVEEENADEFKELDRLHEQARKLLDQNKTDEAEKVIKEADVLLKKISDKKVKAGKEPIDYGVDTVRDSEQRIDDHECNTDKKMDNDLCEHCGEHAGFCDICGGSDCCGGLETAMKRDKLSKSAYPTVTATGEPDQEYDLDFFNKIKLALEESGFEAVHREFDKYQGVYLDVFKEGQKVDRFWIVDSFVQGDEKKNPAHKWKSATLIDSNGDETSANQGDYFQLEDDQVFENCQLILVDMAGNESIIENPKKSDLPDLLSVQTGIEFQNTPDEVYLFKGEKQAEDADPIPVIQEADGQVHAEELVDYLNRQPGVEDASLGVTSKKGTDPSLRPPKKWWDKMVLEVHKGNPSYSEEVVRETVGKIWSKLPESEKSELRNKEGKHYGKVE
jgi:hypothetical protein